GTSEESIGQLSENLKNQSGGTVYCERIDRLTMPMQEKLLELVKSYSAGDIYFIASVGEDPVELIAGQKLLKELYYFFSAMAIPIQPLRRRKEDIMPFVLDYFSRHRLKFGSVVRQVDKHVENILLS